LGIARVQSTQQFGIGGQNTFCPQHHKMAVAAVKNLKSGNFCSSPLPVFISAFIPFRLGEFYDQY
jgi:hypothetical protein